MQGDESLAAREEQGSAQWSLAALVQAALEVGLRVKGSQIRRILLREGVRWRRTQRWGTPRDTEFAAIGTAGVTHSTEPPAGSTTICPDELGPVVPRSFPPAALLVAHRTSEQSGAGL